MNIAIMYKDTTPFCEANENYEKFPKVFLDTVWLMQLFSDMYNQSLS